MLFLRMLLPPNEAWLLVFRAGVLTADFIRDRDSVTQVEAPHGFKFVDFRRWHSRQLRHSWYSNRIESEDVK